MTDQKPNPTPNQPNSSGKSTLVAEGLRKAYKGREVVRGVDFEVESGQVVGLLGPNGAGKTTSFYMVVGLVPASGGRVLLNNEDLAGAPMHERSKRGIGYLPQEASIFRRLTVEENILCVLEMLDMDEADRRRRLTQLLEQFRLGHVAKQQGYTLSGGERRRVEVARALALDPQFLLLDEPFAGIDPKAVNDIQNMVVNLKKLGIGILITDHNVRETLTICDLGYLLSDGKILVQGTPEQILNSPEARSAYLGENFQM
jgi:lipopolysaccharide export system ATP-binding protein